jgi:hypothetical protein
MLLDGDIGRTAAGRLLHGDGVGNEKRGIAPQGAPRNAPHAVDVTREPAGKEDATEQRYGWPRTLTGTLLLTVVRAPSSPLELLPQQYATPFVVRPQVCRPEALSAEKVSPPATATGTVLEVAEPLPRGPEPQQ